MIGVKAEDGVNHGGLLGGRDRSGFSASVNHRSEYAAENPVLDGD